MAIRRHFINNSAVVTLTADPGTGGTTINVADASTFPTSFPWTGVISAGNTDAEEVLVTGATGAALTVTRGYDGSSAFTHPSGTSFAHVAVKADFDEANAHVTGDSGVHGVTGNVVGDTDTQTLTNKTLDSPVFTGTVGPVEFDDTITLGGSATFDGTMAVTGSFGTTGGININGTAIFQSDADVYGELVVTGTGTSSFAGDVTAAGAVLSVGQRLQLHFATGQSILNSLGGGTNLGGTGHAATVDFDTMTGYSSTTGAWTVAHTGQYLFDGVVNTNTNAATFAVTATSTSAAFANATASQTSILPGVELSLTAGDTVNVHGTAVTGTPTVGAGSFIRITRIS